jgi:predicted unusual protein kinase regulating ubiquinone biosynthesis (AarF/ABC1/UbiB family)
VITSELSGGARFAELASWPQHERDLAAETIYRFVFRSLYDVRAFNGDPHPGNYLFHRGGKVTFLDFGLVRRFSPAELQPLMQMARTICVEHDPEAFRPAWRTPDSCAPARRSAPRRSSSTWPSSTTPSANQDR